MTYEINPLYLRDLNLESDDRIREIISFYEKLNIEIKDIFVSEYVKKDGTPVFESLYLFNDHILMEAKNFNSSDNFDMIKIENFNHWEIKKDNYDFEEARINSKIYLGLYSGLTSAELKATGKNCDKLKEIFMGYILPTFTD